MEKRDFTPVLFLRRYTCYRAVAVNVRQKAIKARDKKVRMAERAQVASRSGFGSRTSENCPKGATAPGKNSHEFFTRARSDKGK